MEYASGISEADARGRRFEEVFPGRAAAPANGDRACARARRVEPDHPFASSDACSRCARARARRSSTTFPSAPSASRPALQCLLQIVDVTVMAGRERILRERQNARYDAVVGSAPDAILTLDADGNDPVRQSRRRAGIRLSGGGADRPVDGPAAQGHGRMGQGLRAHPARREPQPSDRAHGAAQERLVELSRGVGVELAERGTRSSSPPSCATSTSGAWRSRPCAG